MKKFKSHAQARQLKDKYLTQIAELTNLVIGANEFLAQPEPPLQENYKTRKLKELETRIEALEQDKDMDKFLSDNSRLMDKLAKQEELNKSTQPVGAGVKDSQPLTIGIYEKGVWVTKDRLRDALEHTVVFDDLVKNLGLEEVVR